MRLTAKYLPLLVLVAGALVANANATGAHQSKGHAVGKEKHPKSALLGITLTMEESYNKGCPTGAEELAQLRSFVAWTFTSLLEGCGVKAKIKIGDVECAVKFNHMSGCSKTVIKYAVKMYAKKGSEEGLHNMVGQMLEAQKEGMTLCDAESVTCDEVSVERFALKKLQKKPKGTKLYAFKLVGKHAALFTGKSEHGAIGNGGSTGGDGDEGGHGNGNGNGGHGSNSSGHNGGGSEQEEEEEEEEIGGAEGEEGEGDEGSNGGGSSGDAYAGTGNGGLGDGYSGKGEGEGDDGDDGDDADDTGFEIDNDDDSLSGSGSGSNSSNGGAGYSRKFMLTTGSHHQKHSASQVKTAIKVSSTTASSGSKKASSSSSSTKAAVASTPMAVKKTTIASLNRHNDINMFDSRLWPEETVRPFASTTKKHAATAAVAAVAATSKASPTTSSAKPQGTPAAAAASTADMSAKPVAAGTAKQQ